MTASPPTSQGKVGLHDSPSTQGTRHSTRSGGSLLEVTDLVVQFPTADGVVNAVSGLSYSVDLGKTLAIVGESGSGKSVSSLAVLGLHNPERTRMSGSINLDGTEVVGLSEEGLRRLRSNVAAMIFQDPQSALHPFMKVGDQIAEAYLEHHRVNRAIGRARAIEMLDRVGIPSPERRARQYPHEFSGGMRQRAMIALGLVNNPKLLIADEPTTALDVTVQAQILDLLGDLQKEFGSAIVLITHDLAVVAEVADDVLVMYGGRCVESGTVKEVLAAPRHPYTWGLLGSVPTLGAEGAELRAIRGAPPSLISLPTGCPFHPRCDFAGRVPQGLCCSTLPELGPRPGQSEHPTRCHLSAPQVIYEEEIAPTFG